LNSTRIPQPRRKQIVFNIVGAFDGTLRSIVLFLAAASSALALDHPSDWPCFQGPLGNGASPETGLLRQWPTNGPSLVWRAKIGQGWGQAAIVGDSVYLCWSADASGTGEVAACLDAKNGTERWRFAYENEVMPNYRKRKQ